MDGRAQAPAMTTRNDVARGVLKRRCGIGKTPLPRARLCKADRACHTAARRSPPCKPPIAPPPAHPARLILTLSLAATVGLGIGRFAYALVLPDMRDSLGWSYSAAGFMNTINAAGYLAGALMASRLIRRFGWSAAVRGGTLACVASLAICALIGRISSCSASRGCLRASVPRPASSAAARSRRPSRSRARSAPISC